MTIKQELIKYAKQCIDDKIISCTKHKWACMRFLRDVDRLKSDKNYPYKWDEAEAKKIVDDDPDCANPKYDLLWQHLRELRNTNVNWGVIS